jgi:hypothetical protein
VPIARTSTPVDHVRSIVLPNEIRKLHDDIWQPDDAVIQGHGAT